jgi:hypothetical protein
MDGFASGSRLHGDQRVPQEVSCNGGRLLGTTYKLDTSLPGVIPNGAFSATTGVDLRFDDSDRACQFQERFSRCVWAGDDIAIKDPNSRRAKKLFRLIFVDFHTAYL